MTLSLKVGGAFVEARPLVKAAGSWRPVQEAFVKVAGVWRRFYAALTITMSSPFASGTRNGPGSVVTGYVTATVTGGSGSYDYSWSSPSADAELSGSPATARWRREVEEYPTTFNTTGSVLVTDLVTGATATATITLSFSTTL